MIRSKPIRHSMALSAVAAIAVPAVAAEANLKIEIPRINVAEYRRPYLAIWIERTTDQTVAADVAVWYDLKKRDNGGVKWLKDMRQWWRKSGRELQLPADGV